MRWIGSIIGAGQYKLIYFFLCIDAGNMLSIMVGIRDPWVNSTGTCRIYNLQRK